MSDGSHTCEEPSMGTRSVRAVWELVGSECGGTPMCFTTAKLVQEVSGSSSFKRALIVCTS
eukprot:6490367-Amphidinium_carterae.3